LLSIAFPRTTTAKQAQPRFGCRVEGLMGPQQPSPAIQQEVDHFVGATLEGDPNSLQQESPRRAPKDGSREGYDIEDLSGVVRKQGNLDGWGITAYPVTTPQNPPLLWKSPAPAITDPQYHIAVSQAMSQNPHLLLAHVRLASPEYHQIQSTNVHPFTFQNWSFIHNGSVNGATSPAVEAKIKQYQSVLGGGPKGTTDSERAFYYYLARLYETTGTVDTKKVPLRTKQAVFAQSVKELINDSTPTYKPIHGEVMGIQGHILIQPACNFILSDGQHLLAFKKVLDLFIGEKTLSNHQKTYVITSEKMMRHDPSVQWTEIPEEHLLTMGWDASGNARVDMEPLRELTEPPAKAKL
jgi:hypothetical protein